MNSSMPSYNIASPVGLIADTHGLLRDEALVLLQGCELILHLGDVGSKEEDKAILEYLKTLAPVHCVLGNIDTAAWAGSLPVHQDIMVNDHHLHLVHRLAGKRRFKLPITLGKLWIDQRGIRGAIIHLL